MFLKSLTLKGFKSFADPTTLEFEPGVTVVVGPNGSGKSNVVDAVAWVLGAQGPSTVRSAKMEDVIFAGTPNRPALGRAEVSLTIDNSSGLLPIDFTEVTITRTLFRTGESEYAINRVPCRLLDIQELLSDTGVGRQQHVIVSQGNLDAVLNARPEERRLVIEEAAGVLKFRRRKERSERRLQSTEASLVRLQDLLREVRRQLRPLEKQAEAARRHGDLQDELAGVRRYLLGRDLAAIEGRLAAARHQHGELGRAAEELRHALTGLDTDLLTAESAAEAARAAEEPLDLADAVSRAEGSKARAGGVVALLEERRRSLGRALGSTVDQDVIAALEGEAAILIEGLVAADEEAAQLLPAADELAAAEEQLARETEEVDQEWHRQAPSRNDAAAEVRGELSGLRASRERSAGETRRLDDRCDATERRLGRLRSERGRLEQILLDTQRAAPGLARAEQYARRVLAGAESQLEATRTDQRQAEADQHRWAARRDALSQALDQARARAGAARLAGLSGVMGTLLELVEIDDGFEAAFEAAAGPTLAAVVVDGVAVARSGLAHFQRDGVTGAVVAVPEVGMAPMDLLWPPSATRSAYGRPADVPAYPEGDPVTPNQSLGSGPAEWPLDSRPADSTRGADPVALRGAVRARLPGVGHLLDRLLAGAVVVEGGWQEAVDLAVARPDLVVVTRSGDRCAGGLWQIGAGSGGVTGPALEEACRQADVAAMRAATAEASQQDARSAVSDAGAGTSTSSGWSRRTPRATRARPTGAAASTPNWRTLPASRRSEPPSNKSWPPASIANGPGWPSWRPCSRRWKQRPRRRRREPRPNEPPAPGWPSAPTR